MEEPTSIHTTSINIRPDPNEDYVSLQKNGARIRQWIEDLREPGCHIPRATLTLFSLINTYAIAAPRISIPEQLRVPYSPRKNSAYRQFTLRYEGLLWEGCAGPEFLALEAIVRPQSSSLNTPPISEITKAFYERCFALEGLKHIFVTTIRNDETSKCIREFIQSTHLKWPSSGEQTWDFGTVEYDAILGTRLGKVVAYFILGAFARGTRRIRCITTWAAPSGAPNMRFDIEAI